MNRRRFLAGAGTLAGAGSLALGTGAFTSVSAERSVSIAVADDFRAFLRLEPIEVSGIDGERAGRSTTAGSEVAFDIPGTDDGENPDAGGVGVDSIYEFHDLLEVVNQGTQPVAIYSEYDGDALADLALVTDAGVVRQNRPVLGVGESLAVGLYIDTTDATTGDYDETLTIVAERSGGNRD